MADGFFWYDLMTPDMAAAAKFYGAVVGWTTQDVSQSGSTYAVFQKDGVSVGGLMPLLPTMPADSHPVWMGYIHVDDVDATEAAIQKEGGALHKGPVDVPGVIRFAVVADPQGAVFLVAKPLDPREMPKLPPGAPGTIAGVNSMPANGRPPSPSTKSYLDGPRRTRWIWTRWGPTSCSPPAPSRWAA